jgi:hypothetical protein
MEILPTVETESVQYFNVRGRVLQGSFLAGENARAPQSE